MLHNLDVQHVKTFESYQHDDTCKLVGFVQPYSSHIPTMFRISQTHLFWPNAYSLTSIVYVRTLQFMTHQLIYEHRVVITAWHHEYHMWGIGRSEWSIYSRVVQDSLEETDHQGKERHSFKGFITGISKQSGNSWELAGTTQPRSKYMASIQNICAASHPQSLYSRSVFCIDRHASLPKISLSNHRLSRTCQGKRGWP